MTFVEIDIKGKFIALKWFLFHIIKHQHLFITLLSTNIFLAGISVDKNKLYFGLYSK